MSRGKVLLTGASGFVGGHMAALLLEQGYEVHGLCRKAGPGLLEGVVPLEADLGEPAALERVPRSWDLVIHLAGASIPSLFRSPDPVLGNVQQAMNLLEHLQAGRVLLVSSCHVYAPSLEPRREEGALQPQGLYGLSKHLVESLAPHYRSRLDLRIARPFNHLGPGQRPELVIPSLIRRLAALAPSDGRPVPMRGMNSVRDFIDVRDVAAAYLAILELDRPEASCFNVCTGKAHSIEELANTIMDLLGQRRPLLFEGRPNSMDDNPYLVGSPDRLMALSRWRPRISLSTSISSILNTLTA